MSTRLQELQSKLRSLTKAEASLIDDVLDNEVGSVRGLIKTLDHLIIKESLAKDYAVILAGLDTLYEDVKVTDEEGSTLYRHLRTTLLEFETQGIPAPTSLPDRKTFRWSLNKNSDSGKKVPDSLKQSPCRVDLSFEYVGRRSSDVNSVRGTYQITGIGAKRPFGNTYTANTTHQRLLGRWLSGLMSKPLPVEPPDYFGEDDDDDEE